jgi:hypothetical protein
MKKFVFAAALAACAATLVSLAPAQAAPDASKMVQPLTVHHQIAAVERTPEQMAAFEATYVKPSGEHEVAPRPTMDAALYAQLKQQAQMAPSSVRPGGSSAPAQLASTKLTFTGATECDGPAGCWIPPDVAGSIGKSQFVSASNDVIEVRDRNGVLLMINSLNGFMGYSTKSLFDPRVQWDEEYQRWIVTADAFAEDSTHQLFFMAFSKTSSATGSWWIYAVNTNGFTGTGAFFDYPMLGISQDAVLFTANVFGASSFQGSYLFAVAKARVYNGFGFSVPVYGGLIATLEPAHQVLTDQNAYAWLAAAPGGSSSISMYAYFDPANPSQSHLYGPYSVSGVASFGIPPGAQQPASCASSTALLDTLDNRFQNQGTQNGDFYYQTHTTNDFNFATTRYYIIKGLLAFAPTVSVQNDYYASGSSYDFNPSIASDPAGHFGLNWSSTNPALGTPASVRFADNNGSNPAGISGINVFTSASCYTGAGTSRWGDYSQTSIDPGKGTVANTNTKIFWIDNETIPSANFWSTQIGEEIY